MAHYMMASNLEYGDMWNDQLSKLMLLFTLVLMQPDSSFFKNTVDPDQLASEEAIWLGSTVFSIQIVNQC